MSRRPTRLDPYPHAQTTKRSRLTSAVTVLSAADPVRLFQDFSTVDLISGGRAEIIAGRGVFTEPFPLFGVDLRDYDQLFSEKLDLLRKLSRTERITWRGNFRSALQDAEISPRPIQRELPIWIGVGGTPQSAVRAGGSQSADGIGSSGWPDDWHQTDR